MLPVFLVFLVNRFLVFTIKPIISPAPRFYILYLTTSFAVVLIAHFGWYQVSSISSVSFTYSYWVIFSFPTPNFRNELTLIPQVFESHSLLLDMISPRRCWMIIFWWWDLAEGKRNAYVIWYIMETVPPVISRYPFSFPTSALKSPSNILTPFGDNESLVLFDFATFFFSWGHIQLYFESKRTQYFMYRFEVDKICFKVPIHYERNSKLTFPWLPTTFEDCVRSHVSYLATIQFFFLAWYFLVCYSRSLTTPNLFTNLTESPSLRTPNLENQVNCFRSHWQRGVIT